MCESIITHDFPYPPSIFRYGLRGFYERDAKPITLTQSSVDGIHLKGGTMLVRLPPHPPSLMMRGLF